MFKSGDTITVRCNDTYAPESPTTICTHNRTWYPVPSCTNITCPVPDVENGHFYYNEQPIIADILLASGSEIHLSCSIGYTPTPANTTLTCQTTGEWSEKLVCSPTTCTSPMGFAHGNYNGTQTVYLYGTVLVPTCDTGFYLSNTAEERVCIQQDSWSGDNPLCYIVQCDEPSVANGMFVSNFTFKYSAQIKNNITRSRKI